MSNLLATLRESSTALDLYQRSLNTVQSNVTNASTPGYARQRQILEAAPFDPSNGLIGGVRAGGIDSARNQYAELTVRMQASSLGQYQEMSASLAQIESIFDVSGDGGVPGALSDLFQSFSAWSLSPNDATARKSVIEQAGQVAQAFSLTASRLTAARTRVDADINTNIEQINELATRVLQYNLEVRNGQPDAVLDARLHSTLEELSQYVDFTVTRETNGTASVLLGGQIPLVMGDGNKIFALRAVPGTVATPKNAGAATPLHIFAGPEDLSGIISQGKLGGLLEVRNQTIPTLIGDTMQDGQMNILAAGFAARVNELLAQGLAPPVTGAPGAPLFVFDAAGATAPTSAVNAAAVIRVNPALTPDQLAAYQPATETDPAVANGIALALAGLAAPRDNLDRIEGLSYTEYYAGIASGIGNKSAAAKDQKELHTQLAGQARSLREQMSGVSLDEEAAVLIQFQRAYQATARLMTVLSEVTEIAVNIGR